MNTIKRHNTNHVFAIIWSNGVEPETVSSLVIMASVTPKVEGELLAPE